MSFMNDVASYKNMITEEIIRTPCTVDESSTEFMIIPKYEPAEDTLVVGEEIIVQGNMDANQRICERVICRGEDSSEYYEDSMDESSVDYTEDTVSMSASMAQSKWLRNDGNRHLLLSESEDGEYEMDSSKLNDDQDADEETIAMFVTASGQQLALYAVEDSEEIFAVAMYDESGEPPTNFQFLLKADVERLIGEGAVRTVKKPTQIKKQLLTTQPPMFFPRNELMNAPVHNEKVVSPKSQRVPKKANVWEENSSLEDSELKEVPSLVYSSDDKHSNVAYLMMDEDSENIDNSEDCQEDDSDSEFVEQSTVQYILFEGDQSDSELTFDEIQATLQNLKAAESKSKKQENRKREQHSFGNKSSKYEIRDSVQRSSNCHSSNAPATLTERKLNLMNNQEEYLETDSTVDGVSSTNLDLSNGSIECTSPESTQIQCKAKRSRKQQLVSVNREDSEIIIQPASLLNEEENRVRKRGKRRRKIVSRSGYRHRNNQSKRMRKIRRKEVEIIEIDVDEEDMQSKRDVIEITIDDSKDKYSSDKENEIIMVGDSDDESPQNSQTSVMQCQHCARNFRQPRALETHLRVCSKSPSNAIRFNEQKVKHASRTSEDIIKKQYACKICQKKFDVVVALARHVRSEHSQRKRRRYSKSTTEPSSVEVEEKTEPVEPKKQLTMIKKIKRKRSQRPTCTWEVKKLSCTDCGRWFPSAALLRAHCLQHGTKKSEQQIRRCHVCQKLIRSRLLFVQHLKKHGNVQRNLKSATNIQKKLHTTRSVTSKITSLRKRGRPRKL